MNNTNKTNKATLIPVDVAMVLGMTHKEFTKLPQWAKLNLARKVYQQQLSH